jgi:CHAT domain-containing protein
MARKEFDFSPFKNGAQKMNLTKYKIAVSAVTLGLILTLTATGQTASSSELLDLPANQTLEREITGVETHRYKLDLKVDEFFQIRAEQKSVDVTLRLLDATGNVLATMDSPNGKEGFETLTFVPAKAGSFILEVINSDAKVEKGIYTIKREVSRTATTKDKRRVEVEGFFVEGMKSLNTDRKSSLKKLKEAVAGWKELADSDMEKLTAPWADFQTMNVTFNEAHTLVLQAQQMSAEGRNKSSLDILNNSKEKILEADSRYREAAVLANNIFTNYPEFVAKNPTLKTYPWLSKVTQVTIASFLSGYYQFLIEPQKQLQYALLAAELAKESRMIDTSNSGVKEEDKILTDVQALQHLASAMQENNNPEAIKFYEQALQAYRELKKTGSAYYDIKQDAQFVVIISQLYSYLCNETFVYCSQKTIEYSQQAIAIYETLKDKGTIVRLQIITSTAYYELYEIYKSLEFAEKALALAQSLENKELISQALFSKSALLTLLGKKEKAKELFRQGLDLRLSIPSYTKDIDSASIPPFEKRNRLRMEYIRLSGIANNYSQIEDYGQAINYYTESIKTAHLLEDKSHQASSLGNIGSAYRELKDWQNALTSYQKSLSLFTEIGDKRRQADKLVDISIVHLELKNPKEALPLLIEAQQIYSSLGMDDSGVTNILAKTWYALGNRRLGIFYNKKLVGWILNQQQKLKEFDRDTQQKFVSSFDKPIRRLADWLIEEGKFAEAEQVLRILKEEEYSNFVRRDANEIKTLNQRIELDDNEKKLIERYKLLADKVSEKGQMFYLLEQKSIRLGEKGLKLSEVSPEEEKEFQRLGGELKDARNAFQTFLDKELVKEIGEARKEKVEKQQADRQILGALGRGTVILYTVVGEDRYRVILTTPTVQVDGKYEIKASELNPKVYAFRDALKNPKIDPRPLGKELYDILIKPVEKDLKASGAKTLLWYLDGTLRYIPLAALSPDGKRYLVEDYQNVVLTSKTSGLQTQVSGQHSKVLGLGVSVAGTVDDPLAPQSKMPFPELPGTKRELFTIVSDEGARNEKGILPGKRFLDEKFTVENFQDSLRARKYNIVHLASHFYLGRKDTSSFLLVGNNQILPLSAIKGSSFITFGGVDLVTLSACNTAFADSSNGSEVDSLADIIQGQGGKSVLATLWSVADESTSLLMSEFYRLRKRNPRLTKIAALQMAQQEMIAGKLKAYDSKGKRRDTGEVAAEPSPDYSHPYYWSPFILIGNWR